MSSDGGAEAAPPRPRHLWLVSDGRSGSTWAGALLDHRGAFCHYFEPCHASRTRRLRGEPMLRHIGREAAIPPVYLGLYRDVFAKGMIKRSGPQRPEKDNILVKDIHCLMNVAALRRHFPEVQVVGLARHPFDVARSKVRLTGWAWFREPRDLLQVPTLREPYLAPHLDLIEAADTEFMRHVLIWCLQHAVFLRENAGMHTPLLSYAALKRGDFAPIRAILAGLEPAGEALLEEEALAAAAARPSRTSMPEIGADQPVTIEPHEFAFGETCITRFGLECFVAGLAEA